MFLYRKIWYWLRKVSKSAPKIIFDIFSDFYSVFFMLNFSYYSLLSKSMNMKSAFYERLTSSLEISVFILDNKLLAAKCSEECTPNHFWEVFSFFYPVYQMLTFFFCWLTLFFESIHVTCACSVRVTESLEISVFIWNDIILTVKSFEEYTHNLFW